MLKKSSIFLLLTITALYTVRKSGIKGILSKPLLRFNDYSSFTDESRFLFIVLGLIILISIIFIFNAPAADQKRPDNKFWALGFFSALLLISGAIIYVNPQGRFPWNKHDQYIELELRSRKSEAYKKLEHPPGLLLLGSSASFLTPMDYFEEKWKIRGFNMSVNGGGPADFVNLIGFVKKTNPEPNIPAVVMVEIINPSLSIENNINLTPLELIPSMETYSQQRKTLWSVTKSALRITSFSDSIFTLQIVDRGRWNDSLVMGSDGTMTRKDEEATDAQYKKRVENNIEIINTAEYCEKLDEQGKSSLKKLVELSLQYKFSLLIYRTPINEDFYILSNFEPSKYQTCTKLFDEYIESITKQNSNVFFKDLNQYKDIARGGKEIYRDTHHLTTKGNILLLEALRNEIELALGWAQENRKP